MPAQPVSREYRVYLALWRKAYKSEEEISFKASTWSMAVAMRQGMYRAIRPFRSGEQYDLELINASEKLVIYLNKNEAPIDEPHTITFRHRKALAELETMFEDLEIDEADLLLGDERKANSALNDFIDRPLKPRERTPFYNRD